MEAPGRPTGAQCQVGTWFLFDPLWPLLQHLCGTHSVCGGGEGDTLQDSTVQALFFVPVGRSQREGEASDWGMGVPASLKTAALQVCSSLG